jgi:hypothetical protein
MHDATLRQAHGPRDGRDERDEKKTQDTGCTIQGKEFRIQKAEMEYCNNARNKTTAWHFSVAFDPIFQSSNIPSFRFSILATSPEP